MSSQSEGVDYREIDGAENVYEIFGRWPSFHDAEVLWIKLDRSGAGICTPTLEAMVHVFEITSDVDESGFLVLRNHVLVHFQFEYVVELQLSDFNGQNALFGLAILDLRGRQLEFVRYEVHFDASFGVSGAFQCRAIKLLSVSRCDRNGVPM